MKTACLILMICWMFSSAGCVWVGSTLTGELGLYYKPPTAKEVYQPKIASRRNEFIPAAEPILGYRKYPNAWRYWR